VWYGYRKQTLQERRGKSKHVAMVSFICDDWTPQAKEARTTAALLKETNVVLVGSVHTVQQLTPDPQKSAEKKRMLLSSRILLLLLVLVVL
jgi:hypothetical protein